MSRGSQVFRSRDRGETWAPLNEGLPDTEITGLLVASAPSTSLIVSTNGHGLLTLQLGPALNATSGGPCIPGGNIRLHGAGFTAGVAGDSRWDSGGEWDVVDDQTVALRIPREFDQGRSRWRSQPRMGRRP